MTDDNKAGSVANLCHAIGNVSRELMAAGVTAEQLAAGLRIEAATIEAVAPRAPMKVEEHEALDVQRRAHEFINTLQVAGLEERTIVAAISNALIERVARICGAPGAAMWLRNLATMVDANGADIERSANHH